MFLTLTVFALQTDVSNNGVEAVLSQEFDGELFPVTHASQEASTSRASFFCDRA